MADNANLGSPGNPAIQDDDPFAELTRIMGFDPRVPVKPAPQQTSLPLEQQSVQAATAMPAAAAEPVHVAPAVDLAIDLERELMGELADDQHVYPQSEPAVSADAMPGEPAAPLAAYEAYDEPAVEPEPEVVADTAIAPNWFRPADVASPSVEMEPEPDLAATQPAATPVAELRDVAERQIEASDLPLAEAEMLPETAKVHPAAFVVPQVEVPAWSAAENEIISSLTFATEKTDERQESELSLDPVERAEVEAEPHLAQLETAASAESAAHGEPDLAPAMPAIDEFRDEPAASSDVRADAPAEDAEGAVIEPAEAHASKAVSYEADDATASYPLENIAQDEVMLDDATPLRTGFVEHPVEAHDAVEPARSEPQVMEPAAADEPPHIDAEQELAASEASDAIIFTGADADDVPAELPQAVQAGLELTDSHSDERVADVIEETATEADDEIVADADDDLPLEPTQPMLSAVTAELRPTIAPVEALEKSLEDEFNALLGNTPDKVAAASAPIVAVPLPTRAHVIQPPAPVVQAQPESDLDMPEMATDDEEWRYELVPAEPKVMSPVAAQPQAQAFAPAAATPQQAAAPAEVEAIASEMDELEGLDVDEFEGLFDDVDLEAAISEAVEKDSVSTVRSEPAVAPAMRNLEGTMANEGHDPYAALTALSADLRSTPAWSNTAARPVSAIHKPTPYVHHDVPDIETIDVPEPAVALADDLDLPEVAFEPEPVVKNGYDDIDSEFANLLDTMAVPSSAAAAHHAMRDRHYAPRAQTAAPEIRPAAPAQATHDAAYPIYSDRAQSINLGTVNKSGDVSNLADMDFAYDPDVEEEMAGPAYTVIEEPRSRWKGYAIMAAAGAMALAGAVGAYAVSFGGGSGSDEVALVKADPSPVKVKPENPGGTAVPNQESKVYDSVRGAQADAGAAQDKLVNSAEEPAPMPSAEDDMPMMGADDAADVEEVADDTTQAPQAGKSEDRVAQVEAEAGVDDSMEVAAVAPRKVRTMIVKADGTLVAREEPTAEPDVDSAAEGAVDPMASNAVPAATPAAEQTAPAADEVGAIAAKDAGTPESAPVAPARPADQPVDIVAAAAQQDQPVAAAEPTAAEPVAEQAAIPAGTYSMQIASQPTQDAAQSSYKSLARKYSGVLEGHQARIVEADIAGKGKYWRVQVPVGSRKDAIKLCEVLQGCRRKLLRLEIIRPAARRQSDFPSTGAASRAGLLFRSALIASTTD